MEKNVVLKILRCRETCTRIIDGVRQCGWCSCNEKEPIARLREEIGRRIEKNPGVREAVSGSGGDRVTFAYYDLAGHYHSTPTIITDGKAQIIKYD